MGNEGQQLPIRVQAYPGKVIVMVTLGDLPWPDPDRSSPFVEVDQDDVDDDGPPQLHFKLFTYGTLPATLDKVSAEFDESNDLLHIGGQKPQHHNLLD